MIEPVQSFGLANGKHRTTTDGRPDDDGPDDDGPDFDTLRVSAMFRVAEAALAQLLEAYEFSKQRQCPVWDFAVEIGTLNKLGLTNHELRWMVCNGLVEHARESFGSADHRTFEPAGHLSFRRKTCFVLTDLGVSVLGPLGNRDALPTERRSASYRVFGAPVAEDSLTPLWDHDRQELRLGEVLVKRFKVPARNQVAILSAFQEEDWPVRIDDPLSPRPDLDPKRRLHDTINSLNRNQNHALIHFSGDGSGQGIRWDRIVPSGNGLPEGRPMLAATSR